MHMHNKNPIKHQLENVKFSASSTRRVTVYFLKATIGKYVSNINKKCQMLSPVNDAIKKSFKESKLLC